MEQTGRSISENNMSHICVPSHSNATLHRDDEQEQKTMVPHSFVLFSCRCIRNDLRWMLNGKQIFLSGLFMPGCLLSHRLEPLNYSHGQRQR